MRQLRRRWYLVALGAVAAPVVGASLAYACTSLATLNLSPTQGPAGQQVNVSGRGFSAHDVTDVRNGVVEIRFDSLNGPVLGTATATKGGEITAAITIPQGAAPGTHMVVATQNRANGTPASGTPARQSFTVVASPAQAANTQASPPTPTSGSAQPAAQAAGVPAAAVPAGSAAPAVVPGSSASGQNSTAAAPVGQAASTSGGTGSGAPGVAVSPADAPSAFGAPASTPAVGTRSMMTPASGPSPLLAGLLVAVGLVLSLGGAAMVVAGRRSSRGALARR